MIGLEISWEFVKKLAFLKSLYKFICRKSKIFPFLKHFVCGQFVRVCHFSVTVTWQPCVTPGQNVRLSHLHTRAAYAPSPPPPCKFNLQTIIWPIWKWGVAYHSPTSRSWRANVKSHPDEIYKTWNIFDVLSCVTRWQNISSCNMQLSAKSCTWLSRNLFENEVCHLRKVFAFFRLLVYTWHFFFQLLKPTVSYNFTLTLSTIRTHFFSAHKNFFKS